jgi:hypothetical protein
VSFTAITLCLVSEHVFLVVSIYFVMDSVRKLLDAPSYLFMSSCSSVSYFKPDHEIM